MKYEFNIEIIFVLVETGIKQGVDFETITTIAGKTFDFEVSHDAEKAIFRKKNLGFYIDKPACGLRK